MAKNSSAKKLRILHIAKWYPNRYDLQNGVFIKKHIQCTATFADVKVLAWMDSQGKTEVVESIENGMATTRVYFKLKTAVSYKRHSFREYIQGHYNNKELPDLIHLHVFSPDLLLVVNWAKKRKIPVVISEHWSGYMRGVFQDFPLWRKTAFRQLGKRVDAVLPVSEFLQDNMIENRIKGRYHVVPNVVEDNPNRPEKQPGFTFVVVADLVDEIKNISGIIHAFEQLEPYATLHIIGGGPDEKSIENKVANSSKKEQIKLYGRLPNDEVLALLPSYHCLINNSRVESFGVTILEAHAAGIPVISTICGGPYEWLEDDDIAIAIGDQNDLRDAMNSMLERKQIKPTFEKWKKCLPKDVALRMKQVYDNLLRS